jgi:hypothetical protein
MLASVNSEERINARPDVPTLSGRPARSDEGATELRDSYGNLWFRNFGFAPIFTPSFEGEECPTGMIHEDRKEDARVFVRLRCGKRPDYDWPVIGRPLTTRWTLEGETHDITHWRPA